PFPESMAGTWRRKSQVDRRGAADSPSPLDIPPMCRIVPTLVMTLITRSVSLAAGTLLAFTAVSTVAPQVAYSAEVSPARDMNALVLAAVKSMPSGGSYAITAAAKKQLIKAVQVNERGLTIFPDVAK